MPNADSTFRPVGDSDEQMHGAPAVVVSGFDVDEQQALRSAEAE